jgi:hypothetical protein
MVIIARKARSAAAPPAAIASLSTRGVICQLMPQASLHHPHMLSSPPPRRRVPEAIGLRLIVGRDLEGERLSVTELWAAVEADVVMHTVNSTVRTSSALPSG